MNHRDSLRCLMLEQLESRCLLAGGFLGHSFVQQNAMLGSNSMRSQPLQLPLFDQRMIDRSQSHQPIEAHRGTVSVDSALSAVRSSNSTAPLISNGASSNESSPTRSSFQIVVITVSVSTSRIPLVNRSADGVASSTQLVNDSSDDGVAVIDEVVERNDPFVANGPVGTSNEMPDPHLEQHLPVDDVVVTGGDERISIVPNETMQSAVIEPLIRRSNELLPLTGEMDQNPWELNSQSIGRLREIRDEAVPTPVSNANTSFDSAITSWFGKATGFIEISAKGRLTIPVEVDSTDVHVLLGATIGQHRSIDLIAQVESGLESSDDDLRGAILAAIAAEQAEALAGPRAQGLAPATVQRISTLGMTGVALAATGLSIAARRKRPSARMEHTR